ncbi:MAG: Rpn family recombination-promoting nuclease/putative transposase [Polyangiaceae bacterium]
MSQAPHDSLFRDVFSHPEHARGELQHLLPPALTARLDWSTLKPVPGTFVDEDLRASYSDLLFSIRLDGRTVLFYLLLEHQSTPDRWMLFRQLKYIVRFLDDWREDHPDATHLPVVIPLLVCHGPKGWSAPTRLEDLFDLDPATAPLVLDFIPRLRTLVDDLTLEQEDKLRARAMTALGRVALWCLKTARSRDDLVAGLAHWNDLLIAVRRAPNGLAAIHLVWKYLLNVHDDPVDRILPALAAALNSEQRKDMASIADQLIERGMAQGIERGMAQGIERGMAQGIERGMAQGERSMLLRLLQARFGPLSAAALARIEQATPAELEQWADRVLAAPSLADVLGEPL